MIENALTEELKPASLKVTDDSHQHVGHMGAQSGKGHFSVLIVSAAFTGQSLLKRHKMVYEALDGLMETDIHALSIKALSPAEATDSLDTQGT